MEASNPYAAPTAEVRDIIPDGEKVALAGLGARFGAFLLDGLFGFLLVYVPFLLLIDYGDLAAISEVNFGTLVSLFGRAAIGALIGLVVWAAITMYLVHRNGQTLGKKLVGIKVVRADGSRATLGRIFWLRNVVIGLITSIPYIGTLMWLVDHLLIFRASRLCLHDQIADTIVVDA